jgi:hypothetical protein
MPTFVFLQHGREVARLQGASKEPIEQTIKKFYKETPSKVTGYVRDGSFGFFEPVFFIIIVRFEAIYRRTKLYGFE